jgi:DNA-binding TFAR19-related protein (PDSD5 family)
MANTPDIPPQHEETLDDEAEQRQRDAEAAERDALLASLDEVLDQLAEAKIEGMPDVDTMLADVLDGVPPELRQEIASAFEKKLEQVRADLGVGEAMTPQQQETLRQLKEHEEQIIAHMLARESRRRIRGLFMQNPGMLEAVLGLGETLRQKGIAGIGMATPAREPQTPDVPDMAPERDDQRGRGN